MRSVCLLFLIVAVCIAGSRAWDPPLAPGQVCRPSQAFYLDCNECMCTADGQVGACGRKICRYTVSCADGEEKTVRDFTCTCLNNAWYCPQAP